MDGRVEEIEVRGSADEDLTCRMQLLFRPVLSLHPNTWNQMPSIPMKAHLNPPSGSLGLVRRDRIILDIV